MGPVLMRTANDCEIAAIATACGVSYEEAEKAFSPLPAVDPIRGNPVALYQALIRLGRWKKNVAWEHLATRAAAPGKTVILIHNPDNPVFQQHWIVLAEYSPDGFRCYWGCPVDSTHNAVNPVNVTHTNMKRLMLLGWPNCAFEVTPDTWWSRLWRWIWGAS